MTTYTGSETVRLSLSGGQQADWDVEVSLPDSSGGDIALKSEFDGQSNWFDFVTNTVAPVSPNVFGFDFDSDVALAVESAIQSSNTLANFLSVSAGDVTGVDNPIEEFEDISFTHDMSDETEGEIGQTIENVDLPTLPVFDLSASDSEVASALGIDPTIVSDLPTSLSDWVANLPDMQVTLEDPGGFGGNYLDLPKTITLGEVGIDNLFEKEVVEDDNIPKPAVLVPAGFRTEPPTNVSNASDWNEEVTVVQEVRNEGGTDADIGMDATINPSWASGDVSATVGPTTVPAGGTETITATFDSGDVALLGATPKEAATQFGGDTTVSYSVEFSGDNLDSSFTNQSGTFDLDPYLPGAAPSVLIDNIIPNNLSIPKTGQLPSTGFEVRLENNGDAPAEGVTISGFGDSATVDIPTRGSKTVELMPSPSLLPGPGGEVTQDIVAEFDGTTASSETATLAQAAPEGPDLGFVSLPDLSNLDPEDALSTQLFEIENSGDQPAPVTLEIGGAISQSLGTVSPGQTVSESIDLSSLSLPSAGSSGDETVQLVDSATGDLYKSTTLPISVGETLPDVGGGAPTNLLTRDDVSFPLTVINGTYADLELVGWDTISRELRLRVTNLSGGNATVLVKGDIDGQYDVGPYADEFGGTSVNEDIPFSVAADAGGEIRFLAYYGNLGEFTQPPNSTPDGTWTVPPIKNVNKFPEFVIGEPSIPSELKPGAPFDISAVIGMNWDEPADFEAGILLNGNEIYTTRGTLYPRGSNTVQEISSGLTPELGSGVLSGLNVNDELNIEIVVRNTPSTPSGAGGVTDSYSTSRFIRQPATPNLSLGVTTPSSLSPTSPSPVEFDITNSGDGVGNTDIEVVSDGATVFTESVSVAPGATETVTFDAPPQPGQLGEYTVSSPTSGISDQTFQLDFPPVPQSNFAVSINELSTLSPGGNFTLEAVVENTGTDAGSTDVTIPSTGDTKNVSLDPGETETVQFSLPKPSPGSTQPFTVETRDTSDTLDVPVAATPQPAYGLSLGSIGTVQPDDDVEIVADVTNTGDAPGTETVSVQGGDASEEVSLDPGETERVTLPVPTPSEGVSESYTVNVGGTQETVTVNVASLSPADFDLDTPSSVTMDDPSVAEVDATVRNTGEESGSTEVSMLDDSEVVELDGGESTTVPLRTDITPSPGDTQDYTVSLSDGTSDTVSVEFPSSIATTGRPTAEIDVENTGEDSGEMTLLLDGNIVGSREVDAGETATFTAEPPLPDPGTESLYEVRVRPDDSSDSGDAERFSMATDALPEPAPPSFNLVDVVAPDEARVGESITVDAIVANTGGESGEVTVRSDGDIRQVTIDGGSQEVVTLSLPSPFNQGFEDYEVSVGDQTEQVSVDFRDVVPDVPDAPELPETPQPPQQPGIPQPPGRAPGIPARPGDEDKPYDGIFTYLDPLGVLGTSEQISLDLFGDD